MEETYKLIRGQAAAALFAILDGPAYQGTEFAKYREAIAKTLPRDMEVIHLDDPAKTRWDTTLIVRLLKQAEVETDKVDGMTLLSRAGSYIRKQAPEVALLEAIREIRSGGVPMSPGIARVVVDFFRREPEKPACRPAV